MTKARRSRLALFEQTRDVVFGVAEGTKNERGWLMGGYGEYRYNRVAVCLNTALYAAERDVIVGDDSPAVRVADATGNPGGMRTQEGIDTQRELALAIIEAHPEHWPKACGIRVADLEDALRARPQLAHHVIVSFNDSLNHGHRSAADQMAEVLALCEKRMFANWVADHPDFQRDAGTYEYDRRSFVEFASAKA